MKNYLKLIEFAIFCNGERGYVCLESLVKNDFRPKAVVFEGDAVMPKQFCLEHGISTVDGERINSPDFIKKFRELDVEFALVIGFSQIFHVAILKELKGNFFNFHAGSLPQYRGGSPLHWQIINGREQIGVSVIRMGARIDDGNVVAEDSFNLLSGENIEDAHRYANAVFARLCVGLVRDIQTVGLAGIDEKKQDSREACYWHQRSEEDSELGSSGWSVDEIINLTRALGRPYSGARITLKGQILCVFGVERTTEKIKGRVGKAFYYLGDLILVCEDGAVVISDYIVLDMEN